MRRRPPWFAIACAVAAVVSALAASRLDIPVLIRAPAALLLAFVLPGLVLTQLSGRFARMDAFEGLAWILGVSIAVVVVTGLGIAAAGAALAPGTWAVVLAGVTLTGAALATIRGPSGGIRRLPRMPHLERISVALLVVAGILTSAAVVYVRHEAAQRERPTATQLWAIPSSDSIVTIGVRSHERTTTSFRLSVDAADAGPREWRMRLEPDQRWEVAVPVTGAQGPLRAWLYGEDPEGALLREVVLWPPFGE